MINLLVCTHLAVLIVELDVESHVRVGQFDQRAVHKSLVLNTKE